MDELLKTIAPTVASAVLGPMAGFAIAGLSKIFGISEGTQDKVAKVIAEGKITPEQLTELKKLEATLQAEERERGFRYAELEFKDRDSARNMAVQTRAKTPAIMTWLIVVLVLGLEGTVLFNGTPEGASDIVLGRILGTLDTALMMVLAFWFGTTNGSSEKTALLAKK